MELGLVELFHASGTGGTVALGGAGVALALAAFALIGGFAGWSRRAVLWLSVGAFVTIAGSLAAGLLFTSRGERQIRAVLASAGDLTTLERIAKQGFQEARGATIIALIAVALPFVLASIGAAMGAFRSTGAGREPFASKWACASAFVGVLVVAGLAIFTLSRPIDSRAIALEAAFAPYAGGVEIRGLKDIHRCDTIEEVVEYAGRKEAEARMVDFKKTSHGCVDAFVADAKEITKGLEKVHKERQKKLKEDPFGGLFGDEVPQNGAFGNIGRSPTGLGTGSGFGSGSGRRFGVGKSGIPSQLARRRALEEARRSGMIGMLNDDDIDDDDADDDDVKDDDADDSERKETQSRRKKPRHDRGSGQPDVDAYDRILRSPLLVDEAQRKDVKKLREDAKKLGEERKNVHQGTSSFPTVSSTGKLDPSIIRRVVRVHQSGFRMCYESGLRSDPSLGGKVVLSFVIGDDGRVTRSSIVSSSLSNAAVESCIRTRAMVMIFPRPEGGDVVVNYPLVFASR